MRALWKWVRWVLVRRGATEFPRSMPESELMAALAVPEHHPLWLAVMQVLEEAEQAAAEQVSAPGLLANTHAPLALAHTAGGLEWLRETRRRLESLRQAAAKVKGE